MDVIITDRHPPQTICRNCQYSLIKIFVRQPDFVGDNKKGTSKTCQYVPGLNKDRSHPSSSLVTLCSTTIHKVGNQTDGRNAKERIQLK